MEEQKSIYCLLWFRYRLVPDVLRQDILMQDCLYIQMLLYYVIVIEDTAAHPLAQCFDSIILEQQAIVS